MGKTPLLIDMLPKLGFSWTRKNGNPQIMGKSGRDKAIFQSMIELAGENGKIRRNQALPLLDKTFSGLCDAVKTIPFKDDDEDMLAWLIRVRDAGDIPLASAIHEPVWIEFVYHVVSARQKYWDDFSWPEQLVEALNLSDFALQVDNFHFLVEDRWKRDGDLLQKYVFGLDFKAKQAAAEEDEAEDGDYDDYDDENEEFVDEDEWLQAMIAKS